MARRLNTSILPMEVIQHQPQRTAVLPQRDYSNLNFIEGYSTTTRGCCTIFKPICLCLACLVAPPLFLFGCLVYPCCSFKGRQTCMILLRRFYLGCCCRINCVSKLTLYEAISRYEEDPPMDKQELIKSLMENRFMISILEILNTKLPAFFFTFLPTGSLREGFAKRLPSSSILASDYDMMLIPDAVSVGEENTNYNGEIPVFVVVDTDEEHPDGYVWLKLNDTYLTQWESLCLRRHIKEEGCCLLSSKNVHEMIKVAIMNSTDMRATVERYFQERWCDTTVTVEKKGPALKMMVSVLRKMRAKICCITAYEEKKTRTLFHADFTIALHCYSWPKYADGFFKEENRRNWPPSNVVDTIKRLGCHVVPKPSTNSLVKLTLEQAECTTYGQSPGLEWRYSFSQAEILMSDCLPPAARTAYLAFKAINKRYLDKKGRECGSYALKCILFRLVESKPVTYWQNEQTVVENFFMELMNELAECLANRRCPHYWIRRINIFGDLTEYDFTRKEKVVINILKSPKKHVADDWLEHIRCLRYNCCYCGDSGIISLLLDSEVGDIQEENECCICCSCRCTYTKNTCPCGPCNYDGFEIEVY